MKTLIFLLLLFLFAHASDNFYYQKDKKVYLTPLQLSRSLEAKDKTEIDYYLSSEGQRIGITKELILKLKEDEALDPLLTKYTLVLKKRLVNTL